LLRSGAMHRQIVKLTKIETRWEVWGPAYFNGGSPQIVDKISKITPISDLLSYKSCPSVEQPRT